tara:strand:+ start:2030 stop:2209 length:180 start_codon:yes stop_codon:yes gene_type:complete
MNLTKEEISEIADHLNEIISDHFHDAIYYVYLQRDNIDVAKDFSDEDVKKIKNELKRTL